MKNKMTYRRREVQGVLWSKQKNIRHGKKRISAVVDRSQVVLEDEAGEESKTPARMNIVVTREPTVLILSVDEAKALKELLLECLPIAEKEECALREESFKQPIAISRRKEKTYRAAFS